MTYSIEEIDLSRIYLDNNNPRHDPIKNEAEIISHLLVNEHIKPLARHIAKAGMTSPLERIAVVAHSKVKGAYIAAEGNRRLCAIKLLADPDKANTEANKKYFRNLAAEMERQPNKLEAVVFKDMKAARPWISLRHEGEQGGIGTTAWDAQQKARFNAQGGGSPNPNIQASLLMDYVRDHGLLRADQIAALSITTLTRYLSNPVFRDMLGLADGKTLTITVPRDEFHHAVVRFLSDALDKNSGVNSRTSAKDRKDYAEKLRTEGVAPATRGLPPEDIKDSPRPPPPAAPAKQRNNRSPDDRRKVIPATFVAHINDKILKRLYDELRTLDAEEFPFAATYLLRAVMEQIATRFLSDNGSGMDRAELHKKLERMAELLKNQGMTDSQLKVLRTMSSDKDSRYSPDTIGHFVHGGAVPTRMDAIKTWDSIERVISTALKQLK